MQAAARDIPRTIAQKVIYKRSGHKSKRRIDQLQHFRDELCVGVDASPITATTQVDMGMMLPSLVPGALPEQ